ncbi:MAG: adenylate/guanylate cyclase domain-containing protein, partial [Spirochaetia bacterium]|nr:adenylate/guanylate cyclase domain-containing protein [Spirochaetia bacterium]
MPAHPDIPSFLKKYPWPAEWRNKGKFLHALWSWDFPVSMEALWPHLADTSTFNKRLGLPEMKFREENGRLQGESVNLRVRSVWEEVPWEWEYGSYLSNMRVYSKGFGKAVRSVYSVEKLPSGGVRLFVYFGWVLGGILGRLLLPQSMRWLEKRYDAVLNEIVARLTRKVILPPPEPPPVLSPASIRRLEAARQELLRKKNPEKIVDRVLEWLRTCPDNELLRIRPRELAQKWGVEERGLLGVFLHATRQGALVLTWDVVCPHCRGVRRELLNLSEIPEKEECEACGIDFSATGLHAVEITFRVHPSIRVVEPRLYCAAEPATKPHIVFKKKLLSGETQIHPTIFPAGPYRLRLEGEKSYSLLELRDESKEKKVSWKTNAGPFEASAHSAPDLALENVDASERIFVVEENRADQNALRPGDLFTFQDFRDLFSEQSVSPDLQLELGIQTVLFTDLVGSSRFYHTVGDAAA